MKLNFLQYVASIGCPLLFAIFCICEWSAVYGHGPYGYVPMIRWPFSCVFTVAGVFITIAAIINAMIQES